MNVRNRSGDVGPAAREAMGTSPPSYIEQAARDFDEAVRRPCKSSWVFLSPSGPG